MKKREIITTITKMGEDLAIILPRNFCEGTTLTEGETLKVMFNDRGNIEVVTNRLIKGERLCELCDTRPGKYECSNCGKIACASCFWEFGGLCHNCMKKSM